MARILIVDDELDAAKTIQIYLQQCGHEVTALKNGRDALSAVLSGLPDVVLLDLLMPEMDGPKFLEVVRSYLRLQSLPVVVLTGLEEGPMIDRARQLKVNAILTKSKATSEDIREAIERAIASPLH
jgi:CheY-like chemotaxis protein